MLSGICCAAITSIEMAKAKAASIKVSSLVISIPRRRNPRNAATHPDQLATQTRCPHGVLSSGRHAITKATLATSAFRVSVLQLLLTKQFADHFRYLQRQQRGYCISYLYVFAGVFPITATNQLAGRYLAEVPILALQRWHSACFVAAEFGGKPIREQNLSEWKQGGYRDWQAKQEALEIAKRLGEDATEWNAEGRAALTDTLALWVVARYAVATRRVAETGGLEGWRLLREMCGDIVELRKGDHGAERLQIERERLKLEKEQSEKRVREKVEKLQKQLAKKERAGFRKRRSRKLQGPRKSLVEPGISDSAEPGEKVGPYLFATELLPSRWKPSSTYDR
jgi:hypothetical protein